MDGWDFQIPEAQILSRYLYKMYPYYFAKTVFNIKIFLFSGVVVSAVTISHGWSGVISTLQVERKISQGGGSLHLF